LRLDSFGTIDRCYKTDKGYRGMHFPRFGNNVPGAVRALARQESELEGPGFWEIYG